LLKINVWLSLIIKDTRLVDDFCIQGGHGHCSFSCFDICSHCLFTAARAALHSLITRQHQIFAAWRAEATRRMHLRQLLTGSLQRWAHLTLARAVEQWKDWALQKASLHRRARMVMALMAGRTQHWALCMLR
jgi:hypothetical protein